MNARSARHAMKVALPGAAATILKNRLLRIHWRNRGHGKCHFGGDRFPRLGVKPVTAGLFCVAALVRPGKPSWLGQIQ